MLKNGLFLPVIFFAASVFSQGNGLSGKTINSGDTIPDTTYYQSESFGATERIYTITLYNPNVTAKEYKEFYINGLLSYYCQYDYDNNGISKIRYYDEAGELTFYGVYTSNTIGGKDYKYYDKTNILLWVAQYGSQLSAIDSSPVCEKVITYTSNNQIYSQKFLEYTADGWLSREIYVNSRNDTTAVEIWGFEPLTNTTTFTFTQKNGATLFNSSTQYNYDKYIYYYQDSNTSPDSAKTFLRDTLLYTVKYEYDSKKWLKSEKLFDRSNVAINRGEYSFDKATNITSYKYYREPSELRYVSSTDFSGLQTETQYYSNNQPSYKLKYSYNNSGLLDTVKKVSTTGTTLSYETYAYYTPYSLLKNYTSHDSTGKVTSYFNYNELGFVTDSMLLQSIKPERSVSKDNVHYLVMKQGGNLSIDVQKSCFVDLSFISLNGRTLHLIRQTVNPGNTTFDIYNKTGSGNYVLKGRVGGKPVSAKVQIIR